MVKRSNHTKPNEDNADNSSNAILSLLSLRFSVMYVLTVVTKITDLAVGGSRLALTLISIILLKKTSISLADLECGRGDDY